MENQVTVLCVFFGISIVRFYIIERVGFFRYQSVLPKRNSKLIFQKLLLLKEWVHSPSDAIFRASARPGNRAWQPRTRGRTGGKEARANYLDHKEGSASPRDLTFAVGLPCSREAHSQLASPLGLGHPSRKVL